MSNVLSPHPTLIFWQPLICFVSVDLPVMDISYKGIATRSLCVWLPALSFMFSGFTKLCCVSVLHCFLWLDNIPLFRPDYPHFSRVYSQFFLKKAYRNSPGALSWWKLNLCCKGLEVKFLWASGHSFVNRGTHSLVFWALLFEGSYSLYVVDC